MTEKEQLIDEVFELITGDDTPIGTPMAMKLAHFILAREENIKNWGCIHITHIPFNVNKIKADLQTAVEALKYTEDNNHEDGCTCLEDYNGCVVAKATAALSSIGKTKGGKNGL